MAALPYMQLYVADYMADTAHLSTLEHGAYLLLIMTYWQRGDPLPSDPRKLARIARCSDDEWALVSDAISEYFQEVDGCWVHGRIERDLAAVAEKSQKARKARAQRTFNERATPVERTSYHTDTDTDTDTEVERKETRARALSPFPTEKFDEFWKAYPNKVGKPKAKAAFVKALRAASWPEIEDGLRRYVAKTDDRPWCNPATWLNQERWADQPAPSRGVGPPASRPVETTGQRMLREALEQEARQDGNAF